MNLECPSSDKPLQAHPWRLDLVPSTLVHSVRLVAQLQGDVTADGCCLVKMSSALNASDQVSGQPEA